MLGGDGDNRSNGRQSLPRQERNSTGFIEQFHDEPAGKSSGWFAVGQQALNHSATMRESIPEYFKQPLALQDKKYGRNKSIEK